MGFETEGFNVLRARCIESHILSGSDGSGDFFVVGFRPTFRGGWRSRQLGMSHKPLSESIIFGMDDCPI